MDVKNIRMLGSNDAKAHAEHIARLMATSGLDGAPIFTVYPRSYEVNIPERIERSKKNWSQPVSLHGWERSWGAFELVDSSDSNKEKRIIGEVTLFTSRLAASQSHRALLGMGIEPNFRQQGLGTALISAALAWAKDQPGLEWIDLGVFAHNLPARKLYQRFGFVEVGRIVDCFRVDQQRIDDIQMALELRRYQPPEHRS